MAVEQSDATLITNPFYISLPFHSWNPEINSICLGVSLFHSWVGHSVNSVCNSCLLILGHFLTFFLYHLQPPLVLVFSFCPHTRGTTCNSQYKLISLISPHFYISLCFWLGKVLFFVCVCVCVCVFSPKTTTVHDQLF